MNFQKLFESAPGLYLVLAPDFEILAVSDNYLRATMTERKQIIGKGLFEIFPDNPEDVTSKGTNNLRASLERVKASKVADSMSVQKYDIRKPESEGGAFEVRYWSPINSPVLDDQGELVQIIHRVEDVTEFVKLKNLGQEQGQLNEELKSSVTRMEADILKTAAALLEANNKLRASYEEQERFFSVSLDMLCISGFDGYFKKLNPAFEATLGFSNEELRSHSYLDFIHPDDIEVTRLEVEKQFKTGAKVLNFENRYRHKDGSYRLLSWKSVPVGEFMYAAARDITESRKAEHDLKRAKEDAEIANRELESFSYSVAHDLRAPLRSMMGFSSILLEDHGATLVDDAKALLIRVISASKKMGLLIDGLLDVSRISRVKIVKERVDLSLMAREIGSELEAAEPNRKVQFEVAPDLNVLGSPVLLKVALANLIGNAWKYTSKNTGPVKIEVGSIAPAPGSPQSATQPTFFVRDNGAGFEMKHASKLFGVFQRLHGERDFPGTGIGLATVHRIVASHGGKIWVDAAPGTGATFYFTL